MNINVNKLSADNTTSFTALKNVRLYGDANCNPKTSVNEIIQQFKTNETFQKFCRKFDVDLFIGTYQTKNSTYGCYAGVDYKSRKPDGFFAVLKHHFKSPENLICDYIATGAKNKFDAEKNFKSTQQYQCLIKKMDEVLNNLKLS